MNIIRCECGENYKVDVPGGKQIRCRACGHRVIAQADRTRLVIGLIGGFLLLVLAMVGIGLSMMAGGKIPTPEVASAPAMPILQAPTKDVPRPDPVVKPALSKLVGRWEADADDSVVDFFSDGTWTEANAVFVWSGNYTLDEGTAKVELLKTKFLRQATGNPDIDAQFTAHQYLPTGVHKWKVNNMPGKQQLVWIRTWSRPASPARPGYAADPGAIGEYPAVNFSRRSPK